MLLDHEEEMSDSVENYTSGLENKFIHSSPKVETHIMNVQSEAYNMSATSTMLLLITASCINSTEKERKQKAILWSSYRFFQEF